MTTKMDVIEAHLRSAIQMIAVEISPISVHLPVMAAEEMLLSIARAKGVTLHFDYRHFIKDEHQQEWRYYVRRAYNYFKHADRDAAEEFEGPDLPAIASVNEVQALIGIFG